MDIPSLYFGQSFCILGTERVILVIWGSGTPVVALDVHP